jgi:hypothetical protein
MADVAWSTFPIGDHPSEHIHPGDDISQDDLGVDDAEYAELKALGAIREVPYPIPRNEDGSYQFLGSPREYALAQLAQMSAEEFDASVVNLSVIPQLQAQAQAAMDETGYDETAPPDEEAQAEAAKTEAAQGTRNVEPPGGAKVTNKASSSAKDK